MAKTKKAARIELRATIRAALLEQLTANGTQGEQYADLVEDYMKMWDTKNLLADDIATRGVTVRVVTKSAVNIRKNDSIDQLIKINAQMLKLLSELGIKPVQEGNGQNAEM